MENLPGQMETDLLVNFRIIIDMEKEFFITKMVELKTKNT
jgi:hypothetical protein